MTIKTKQQLLNQFPDNQTRQITPERLRDLVDTSFDLSDKEYWKVYHVNQGVATDDSGDGTYDNPFYTVHAALEKMNEEKALLGIAPGEISDYLTKIVVWGNRTSSLSSPDFARHYESLLITRQKYVQWSIVAAPGRQLAFSPGFSGVNRISNVENYNDWTLPSMMITNILQEDFVDNFLKPCWDTRTGDYKYLYETTNYSDLYGENNFGAVDANGLALGIGYELTWNGGDLLGDTFFDSFNRTNFVGSIDSISFSVASGNISFLRTNENDGFRGCGGFVISGLGPSGKGVINGGNLVLNNCSGLFTKNVTQTEKWIQPADRFEHVIVDNAQGEFTGASIKPTSVPKKFIFRPKSQSNYGRFEIEHSDFYHLSIEGDATGYSAADITFPPVIKCYGAFSVTGAAFVGNYTTNSSYFFTENSNPDVYARNSYIATTRNVNLSGLTSRSLCKGNTGILSIVNAKIGDYQVKGVSPTLQHGSGILLVSGTLNIGNLSCYGDVLMRAGTTANLSGIIEGNLVVAAGATLNAVSLTVKGNVTFEAGATITWKGGTYTGTLTDPDNHFGGATPGSYINI